MSIVARRSPISATAEHLLQNGGVRHIGTNQEEHLLTFIDVQNLVGIAAAVLIFCAVCFNIHAAKVGGSGEFDA